MVGFSRNRGTGVSRILGGWWQVGACLVALSACQPGEVPSGVAARPRKPLPARSSVAPAGVPSGIALFGDYPDDEMVPLESRLVTNYRRHTFTAQGLDFDPDVYDAEGLLVFASTRNSEHPDLFLKKVDGTTLTQLTSDPADDIQPRFSPDGQRIAFCSNRSGSWDLWLVNRDGTGLTQLTSDATDEMAPCWSPDGEQIAYTVWGHRSRQWEIWTLSLAQPGVRRFLSYGMFPAWSPDGARIAFQRARQRGTRLFSIWTVDLVDGEAREPTELVQTDGAACIAPRWSPDGSMIVYCAVRQSEQDATASHDTPREADIWVVDLATGLRIKLTDGSAAAFNPVWAGNNRVFFVSSRAGTENIWSVAGGLKAYATTETARLTRAAGHANSELTQD